MKTETLFSTLTTSPMHATQDARFTMLKQQSPNVLTKTVYSCSKNGSGIAFRWPCFIHRQTPFATASDSHQTAV
ncbi:hypothetical protein SAMN05660772_01263 [Pasteurella testudinis DSM 23072]|uniref:Uncharacterized protein n=1 Tax=Pasteurella testudinis DSM 23072 TaxID=1122938 RepID=A0A1W1V7R0_9PAST|nr:hypothetical protein SAMN05660772_01263 [Pasteurella testudinis DSM 23072]SUB50228.1 Uncharacterised protein [Pasteurella testudinis]